MNPDEVRFRLLRGDDVPATNPLNLAYRFGLQGTKQEIVAGERQPNGTLVLDFSLKLKEGKDRKHPVIAGRLAGDFSRATSSITGIVVVRGVSDRHLPCHKVGMEETKLEKLARLSGKATSKALDALGKRGFDIRGKLSAPISRVPRRTPPEKPKSDA